MDYQQEANRLMALGYRRTSTRHRIISRIDRVAWKVYMAKKHSPWSLKAGLRWVVMLGIDSGPDHYRRCHSEDRIENVHPDLFKLIKSSNWDECGFCLGGINKSSLWEILQWYWYRARWIIL